MSTCDYCRARIEGGPGSHPPEWCRNELMKKVEILTADFLGESRSCRDLAQKLEKAQAEVERLKGDVNYWVKDHIVVQDQREEQRRRADAAELQVRELYTALDRAHSRIGRPRHCGKDGCPICHVLSAHDPDWSEKRR